MASLFTNDRVVFSCRVLMLTAAMLLGSRFAFAVPPDFDISEDGLEISRVSADNPMVYDNDWWKDVPDAAYLWAKASLGEADLRGNIVSRDMWGWQEGYTYKLEQGMEDAQSLLEAARASGLSNIPQPITGADAALVRPESGTIGDTQFTRSPGSDLIVAEAKKATPEKPLLVYTGGPCTTVAVAYLTDLSIADRIIVFQIDGGRSDLGKANQWGDGAWLFYTFDRNCLTKAVEYDGDAITVPREGTNVEAMEDEFFSTMTDSAVYRGK